MRCGRPVVAVTWLAALIGLACSGPTPAPSPSSSPRTNPSAGNPSAGNPSAGNPSAGNPSAGNPSANDPSAAAGCPASFAEASRLAIDCDQPAAQGCDYPEGRCSCDPPRQCGGMRMQPIIHWSCTSTPPAVRPDGCPGKLPGAGLACSPEGKHCRYHGCDPSARCEGGVWHILPPPLRS